MAAPNSPVTNKGRPPDTPIFRKKLALTKNCARYSYVSKSAPSNPFLSQREGEPCIGFNQLVQDNVRLVQDANKNNLSNSPTRTPNKCEKYLQKSDKNLLRHGFPKILCLKKNPDSRNAINANVNSLESLSTNKSEKCPSKTSLDIKNENVTPSDMSKTDTDYTNNYYPEKQKNRNSFHQNVDEALSSLLWQPYEYQNQSNSEYNIANNGNDSYDYESYSTCSYTPSTSPISLDLDETYDNVAPSPSNTKKNAPFSTFLQCTAAVPPLCRRDLHSDVINLNRQEPSNQLEQVPEPRDGLLQRSGTGAFVSLPSLASSLLDFGRNSATRIESVTSCSGEFSGESSMHGGSGSAGGQNSASVDSSTVSNSDHGLKSGQVQADSSLNAANIVGLPSSHARYASVPCSGTSAGFQNVHAVTRSHNVGYSQHFRNISEPSQQILRYPNTNNEQVAPLIHQKSHTSTGANSQIDQHNLQLINHFRSSSVPKSMTLVPKYDLSNSVATGGNNASLRIKGTQVFQQNVNNNASYGNAAVNANINSEIRLAANKSPNISVPIHQNLLANNGISTPHPQITCANPALLSTPPNNGNVSNINVNFYRAVPVNVVSSVPTIHCLNTLSNDQGNSVSNVQVLPLGNINHQLGTRNNAQNGQNPQFVPTSLVNNSGNQRVLDTSTGGQVTVHNVNAIRIDNVPSGNQIITSNVGYHEQNCRNTIVGETNNFLPNAHGTMRGSSSLPVSMASSLIRNVLLPSGLAGSFDASGTGFFNHAVPGPPKSNNISSIINVHNNAETATNITAGRIITTTAQINTTAADSPSSNNLPQPPAANTTGTSIVRTRTFTSTEAQTDDILPIAQSSATQNQTASAREQRRRERRERRQNRRNHNNINRTTNDCSTQAGGSSQTQPQVTATGNAHDNRLPDILNSHLPPPYSTLPNVQNASLIPPQIIPPPPPQIIPGAMLPNPPGPVLQTVVPNGVPASAFVFPAPQQIAPLVQGGAPVPVAVPATAASGFRFGFPANGFRRSVFNTICWILIVSDTLIFRKMG